MKESVAKFFELVRQDRGLAEKLRGLAGNMDEFSRVSSQLARERGFEFEPTDVQEALASLTSQQQEPLNDDQLEAVVGGTIMAARATAATCFATICGLPAATVLKCGLP